MVVGRFRGSSAVALPQCTKPPPAGKELVSSRGRWAGSGVRQIICTFWIHQIQRAGVTRPGKVLRVLGTLLKAPGCGIGVVPVSGKGDLAYSADNFKKDILLNIPLLKSSTLRRPAQKGKTQWICLPEAEISIMIKVSDKSWQHFKGLSLQCPTADSSVIQLSDTITCDTPHRFHSWIKKVQAL